MEKKQSVWCVPPSGCRCCECAGKKCLIDHPGHSHTDIRKNEVWAQHLLEVMGEDHLD